MHQKNSNIFLGIMSGTSLDGVDMAACRFWEENKTWRFEIVEASTHEYSAAEVKVLKNAIHLSGVDLISLHHQYGSLIGKKAKLFCDKSQLKPNYIASHGHTIFHQPNNNINFFNAQHAIAEVNGFTFQLGHGANIAAASGIKTICDFRTSDVAYGGQGAPLVPIGDELLFSEYNYCLNLGGISNISFNQNGRRTAFDIGICNMALNELAEQANFKFDRDGLLARSGIIDESMLKQLVEAATKNHLNHQSLGYEWYAAHILPIMAAFECKIENKLRTLCEFIAMQITLVTSSKSNILVTGGGAKNIFLMECIKQHTQCQIIYPTEQIIEFKEALIFAFLGLLRVNQQANSLHLVTGASKDAIGGCVYLP
jgi:anhydro-N-acetylmuramic acid kinase